MSKEYIQTFKILVVLKPYGKFHKWEIMMPNLLVNRAKHDLSCTALIVRSFAYWIARLMGLRSFG